MSMTSVGLRFTIRKAARRATDAPTPRRLDLRPDTGRDVAVACTRALVRRGLPANEMDFIRPTR